MAQNFINRWVFSPLETVPSPMVDATDQNAHPDPQITSGALATVSAAFPPYELPICRQYAQMWNAPWHENGFAMVNCMMDPTHLAAAQADSRLIVLGSISSTDPIPQPVSDWFTSLETTPQTPLPPNTNLAQLLEALEHLHVDFMPEQ
jgi:hypothetical protein